MSEPNFNSVEVMPKKKTFQELSQHKRLFQASTPPSSH